MEKKNINLLKLLKKINYSFFILFGFIAGIIGTLFSIIIRVELAYPGVQVLGGDWQFYNVVVAAYVFIMIFFMVISNMIDILNNSYVPLLIGTADMYLNVLNFWLLFILFLILYIWQNNKKKCLI
jgi:heme/copper-type cytochrome/quinol oxidase subunit 1